MRIGIREQLAAVVLLTVLISLAIVSIPTWIYVNGFVGDVKSQALALTASLKAAQIASVLNQLQAISNSITTRVLLQDALKHLYAGKETNTSWAGAYAALETALLSSTFVDLLQARVYTRNSTGDPAVVLNVTKPLLSGIGLPYTHPDGSPIYLGDSGEGFPSILYPNLTTTGVASVEAYPSVAVTTEKMLLLGPLILNDTYALVSLTQPVVNNGNHSDVIGYVTIVAAATELFKIESSSEGLGDTGAILLIGPDTRWNRFRNTSPIANTTNVGDPTTLAAAIVKFVIPVVFRDGQPERHLRPEPGADVRFPLFKFPAALNAYSQQSKSVNNASSLLETTNENDISVSVGVARPPTSLVDWIVLVEQTQAEALAPIALLRKILLICVFGTVGLVLAFVLPFAHLSVLPIRRLKGATEKFVIPPGYDEALIQQESRSGESSTPIENRRGLNHQFKRFKRRHGKRVVKGVRDQPGKMMKIPGKIDVRKHLIVDELTDLTITFNDMSDELMRQYTLLEDKVAERTKELELSKKAAEAANQSKTVFIANVSHELKTPLNGILGMCSVCMEETDLVRIKQSLKTVYESGTLLFRLLEDLLNFARYEAGQPTRLEENMFCLADIGRQATAFFTKDARDRGIDFTLTYIDAEPSSQARPLSRFSTNQIPSANSCYDITHVQNMQVWGDQHRILQVVINLITNSLKFTAAGGRVDLRIKCVGESVPNLGRGTNNGCAAVNRDARSSPSESHGGSAPGSAKSASHSRPPTPMANDVGPALPATKVSPPAAPATYLFEFEVEDTGHGIPEDIQQRIFEPFVQGEFGLARKFGGAGLGLAICRQLATLMGGTISLQSTLGVGSTFTMRLPLRVNFAPSTDKIARRASLESVQRPKAVDSNQLVKTMDMRLGRSLDLPRHEDNTASLQPLKVPETLDKKEGSEGLRVLVVDDNATNLEVLTRMLLLENVSDVQVATDGREAYNKVKDDVEHGNRFDIIFMDIQMPEMDGVESTRLIRKLGYTAPIVALTAFAEDGIAKQCSEAGVDHFLSKPINRKGIKEVLQTFCATPDSGENGNSQSSAQTKDSTITHKISTMASA